MNVQGSGLSSLAVEYCCSAVTVQILDGLLYFTNTLIIGCSPIVNSRKELKDIGNKLVVLKIQLKFLRRRD